MNVSVAFLPALVEDIAQKVVVAIDVLRATTTLVVMCHQGGERVVLAETTADGRSLRRRLGPEYLLCGEENGLPPAGFDHGNSPVEFSTLDLTGRQLILCTSNGTRTLLQVAQAPVALVGSLVNGWAVLTRAVTEAQARGLDLTLVCSGHKYASSFGIDDAYCAGFLVGQLIAMGVKGLKPEESALAALRLCSSYADDTLAAFKEAANGRHLISIGLTEDLRFCAQRDVSQMVPRLYREGDLLVVRKE